MGYTVEQLRAWNVPETVIQAALDKPAKRDEPAPTPTNKYHAQPTHFQGRRYASKWEATGAVELERQYQAGEIDEWNPQPIVILEPGVEYRPDFEVKAKGSFWYVERKGRDTERFRVMVDLWRLHGKAPLHIERKGKATEIIPGGKQR